MDTRTRKRPQRNVPANLITGFLGVGKTTAIRHLLEQRPETERWAVLVNEFGEIGVDGGLLADTGVMLEEVPGGCLCCVSAQLFTVGLNRLIHHQNPDRILIEPTGLGHPAQITRTLTEPPYIGVLDLRATVTLMDARHLRSLRHREHPIWRDQIALADILVANKLDVYTEPDREALREFVTALPTPRPRAIETSQGRVASEWLNRARLDRGGALFPEARAFLQAQGARADGLDHAHDHKHDHDHRHGSASGDWVTIDTHGDRHIGRSWWLPNDRPLDHGALQRLVSGFSGERLNGLLLTDRGWQQVNQVNGDGQLRHLPPPTEPLRPRIEAIVAEDNEELLGIFDTALRRTEL